MDKNIGSIIGNLGEDPMNKPDGFDVELCRLIQELREDCQRGCEGREEEIAIHEYVDKRVAMAKETEIYARYATPTHPAKDSDQ